MRSNGGDHTSCTLERQSTAGFSFCRGITDRSKKLYSLGCEMFICYVHCALNCSEKVVSCTTAKTALQGVDDIVEVAEQRWKATKEKDRSWSPGISYCEGVAYNALFD